MYLVKFNKLDFQRRKPEDPTVPIGDPVTLTRGERVPEWATEFEVNALMNAGMIVYASDPDPTLVPPDAIAPQVRTPDQPLVLPSDPHGVPPLLSDRPSASDTASAGAVVPDGSEPAEPAEPLGPLPKDSETKDVWEQYATHPLLGMTLGEAEAMNKKDLVTEVKRRHAISAEPVQP